MKVKTDNVWKPATKMLIPTWTTGCNKKCKCVCHEVYKSLEKGGK